MPSAPKAKPVAAATRNMVRLVFRKAGRTRELQGVARTPHRKGDPEEPLTDAAPPCREGNANREAAAVR